MRICILAILCVVSSWFLPSNIVAAQEAEPYFYYYLDKPKPLGETPDALAVFDRSRGTADPLRGLLEEAGVRESTVERHPVAGWFRVRLGTESADPQGIPGLIQRLATHDVAGRFFFSPIFIGGGPVIVTPEILVQFEEDVDEHDAARLLREVGLQGAGRQPFVASLVNSFKISTHETSGIEVLWKANRLNEMEGVVFAEPNKITTGRSGTVIPTDPEFDDSWGLLNTGQFPGAVAGFDIGVTEAWDKTFGDPRVITVVLDVGVQQDHPDINQEPGRDFTSDGGDGGPVNECDNHGTPVAGVITGRAFNSRGTVGVAPATRIVSARTFISITRFCDGSWIGEDSWTVEALQWARDIGARITNNSNWYRDESTSITLEYKQLSGGILHFASAGNQEEGTKITFPASLDWVRGVTAMNWDGNITDFSSFGPQAEFTAPGRLILTTDRTGADGWSIFDTVFADGTSFAAPMAAGVAALVYSVEMQQTPFDVLATLVGTIRDLGQTGRDELFGYGLVNAALAVKQATDTIFRDGFESGDVSRWSSAE